jgi:hypothetical protein
MTKRRLKISRMEPPAYFLIYKHPVSGKIMIMIDIFIITTRKNKSQCKKREPAGDFPAAPPPYPSISD